MDLVTWFIIAGGLTVVWLVFFLRRFRAIAERVPLSVATGLLGAVVGGGLSLVTMHGLGFHWQLLDISSTLENADPVHRDTVTSGELQRGKVGDRGRFFTGRRDSNAAADLRKPPSQPHE